VAGVAVGLVLAHGIDSGRDSTAVTGQSRTAPRIAADVDTSPSHGDAGPQFSLLLLNEGPDPVELTDFAFDDLHGDLVKEVGAATLTPGLRRAFQFSAPPDCFTGVTNELTSVKLFVRSSAGKSVVTVPLPEAGQAVLEYQRAICDPTPVTREEQLLGVWILEEPYGLFSEGKGVHLLQFNRDGTYDADPEGLLLRDVEHGVEGSFSLDDGELTMPVDGGYGCRRRDRTVWRAGLLEGWGDSISGEGPRLTLTWVRGSCPDNGQGEVWVLRRVAKGVGGETG
jgi:hypothetical protein